MICFFLTFKRKNTNGVTCTKCYLPNVTYTKCTVGKWTLTKCYYTEMYFTKCYWSPIMSISPFPPIFCLSYTLYLSFPTFTFLHPPISPVFPTPYIYPFLLSTSPHPAPPPSPVFPSPNITFSIPPPLRPYLYLHPTLPLFFVPTLLPFQILISYPNLILNIWLLPYSWYPGILVSPA